MTASDQSGAKGWRAEAAALPRARRFVIAFAMLLALLGQSFVTQTHIHADPAAYGTAIAGESGAAVRLKSGQAPSDLPATCPICQEIAHAGSYLSPSAIAFQPPVSVGLWRGVTPSLAPTLRQRSHAWRSRAPPHQLQA